MAVHHESLLLDTALPPPPLMDDVTMLIAKWNGKQGKVISDQVGRVLVDFGEALPRWLLKGIEGLEIVEQKRGRPRKHSDQAEKQRAYRERKAGKALRKYVSKEKTG